ncbi:MAG: hypothetical protein KDG50_11910 [Chromatiales bacterium]|nr:hypothetical protein [Chromatiales bacterium]
MSKNRQYVGIHRDPEGGMNQTGNIIRDAWVFGLLPETETCEGWEPGRIEALWGEVTKAWAPYGHLPSQLPPELRERHQRIYAAAIKHAHEMGWDPDSALDSDH